MIHLYSLATPNGQKVSIALEEMGLAYQPHVIDITSGDQFKDEFVKINPNSKIPAIVDEDGPGNQALSLFESGAILQYLAEKSGKFLPSDPRKRIETFQWLFFQMGGIGPMFGQFGHFYKYAGEKCLHPYPTERYANETKRLLAVLDKHLVNHGPYMIGEQYSIADMSIFPWVLCLDKFYMAKDKLDLDSFKKVNKWLELCLSRPKVAKGLEVCKLP